LSPATAALYDLEKGTLETWRYWSLPEPAEEKVADIGSIVEDLETLLLNSVRHRLVADVPVGILLSGGVDSSLITAAAARVSSSRLQTFTVSFPGNGSFDETAYARRIANYFGTEHHELEFESNLVSLLPEMATIFDEPLADSSLVPTYAVSRLARRHVTVALGGDGGDELFGGYPTYRRNVGWRGVLESLPHYLKRPISIMAKRWMPLGMRGRQHLHSIGGNTRDNFILRSLIFDVYTRRRLLQSSIWQSLTEYSEEPEQYKISLWAVNEMASVERMSRLDFATHLPDDILVKVDRASMAVSLELRSPWLDREILEFAFGKLPVSLKVEKNVGRIIQRRLAKSLLPLDFDLNRKQGFSIPPRFFQGNGWSDICNDLLTHADSELFNRTTILGLLALARLRPSVSGYLFPLVMFEFWRRHYRISPPGLPEGNN
jgi:asparagine synthase (glutamine-hydrolysing)